MPCRSLAAMAAAAAPRRAAPRRGGRGRRAPLAGLAAAWAALAAAAAAASFAGGAPPRPAGGARPRAGAAWRAAESTWAGTAGRRSWKEAHDAAKEIQDRLQRIISGSAERVSELDALSTGWGARAPRVPPVPQSPPNPAEARKVGDRRLKPFGKNAMGEALQGWFEAPEGEAYRDLEQDPPVLAFGILGKGSVVGTSPPELLELPERLYPVQLTAGAQDDPGAGPEENRLWKGSMELVVEQLELLWPDAERAAASVQAAEARAEARVPADLAAFRRRALDAMEESCPDPTVQRPELERCLGRMQSDKGLLRKLYWLENKVLELEGCNNQLSRMRAEAQELSKGSADLERKMRSCSTMEERAYGCRVDIWNIADAVRGAMEIEAAEKQIGKGVADFFSGLNPFR